MNYPAFPRKRDIDHILSVGIVHRAMNMCFGIVDNIVAVWLLLHVVERNWVRLPGELKGGVYDFALVCMSAIPSQGPVF